MSIAYYNEIDPAAAAWLRELIRVGLIAPGDVDERSIEDVQPDDLKGYCQCHFFAGIGGWSYALRLAGWPDDRPVWTGSCPCQPFSCAGKGRGEADERHLWPEWFRLIRQYRPARLRGEQVASKAAMQWLDGVFADLEGEDYACGAADLCAACVGAPHIRQRLYWLADAENMQLKRATRSGNSPGAVCQAGKNGGAPAGRSSSACGLADADKDGRGSAGQRLDRGEECHAKHSGGIGGLGDTKQPGLEGHARHGDGSNQPGRLTAAEDGHATPAGAWSDFGLVYCRDGKTRRIEPGTFPLVDGVPGRVGLLRGYGNAIVPQVAAEFIRATTISSPTTISGRQPKH